ncbi:prokineticin domain-containing protein [Nephila pilipes]|uniref:Prokineticin domain-containing protein n=1 Tax=Nephila pilipes TaxID=299642 RepID=A0A8X6TIV1_NEPPI|nr:prokineticin domain-containing protein [Nephila pilipes]
MKWIVLVSAFTACMAVAHGIRCEQASDCGDDECCVARTSSQLMGRGRCRRLNTIGQHCTPETSSVAFYGGKYLRFCPCRDGLTCEPNGRYRQSTLLSRASQRCYRAATTTTSSSTASSAATTPSSTTSSAATTPSSTTSSEATTSSSTTTSEEITTSPSTTESNGL